MKIRISKSLKVIVITMCIIVGSTFNFNASQVKANSCFESQLSVPTDTVLEGYEIQFDLEYQSSESCSAADIKGQEIQLDFSNLVVSGDDIKYSLDTDVFDVAVSPDGVVTLIVKDLSSTNQSLIDFGGKAVFSMNAKDVDANQQVSVTNSNGDNMIINIVDITRAAENTNKGSLSNYVEVGDTVTYQVLINNHEESIKNFHGIDSHSFGLEYIDGTFNAQQDEVWIDMSDYFTVTYDDEGNMLIDNTQPFDVPVLLTYKMVVTDATEIYHNQFEAIYNEVNSEIVGDDVWYNLDSDSWITYAHGNITINKKNLEGKSLSQAEFDVIDSNGEVVDHLITDSSGQAESSDLQLGTYTVIETKAPEGYDLDSTEYKVELSNDNLQVNVQSTSELIDDSQHYLQIRLMNNMGEGLANASFGIYDSAGNLVDTITTDENGNATSKYLKPGKYYLQQLDTADGYLINTQKYWFEIGGKNANFEVEITNQKIKGSIQVGAVDNNQNYILGTEFAIYKSNGELLSVISANDKGIASLKNLEYGSYYLIQSAVPQGYTKDSSKHYFNIENQGDIASITVQNNTNYNLPIDAEDMITTSDYSLVNTGSKNIFIYSGLLIIIGCLFALKQRVNKS